MKHKEGKKIEEKSNTWEETRAMQQERNNVLKTINILREGEDNANMRQAELLEIKDIKTGKRNNRWKIQLRKSPRECGKKTKNWQVEEKKNEL